MSNRTKDELVQELGAATKALLDAIYQDLDSDTQAMVAAAVATNAGRVKLAIDTGNPPAVVAVLGMNDGTAVALFQATPPDPLMSDTAGMYLN